MDNISFFDHRHNKLHLWKVIRSLGTQCKIQYYFVFYMQLFRQHFQVSDACCYVTSNSQLLRKNLGECLLFSVLQVHFNLKNKNFNSKRTWVLNQKSGFAVKYLHYARFCIRSFITSQVLN